MARAPPVDEEDGLLLFCIFQELEFEKMKLSDYCKGESKYLRADDLDKRDRVELTIDRVKVEAIEDRDTGKKRDKAVVYFTEWPRKYEAIADKGLALNVCNGDTLIEAYGDDPKDIVGKVVILAHKREMAFGEMTDCLRLEIPSDYSEPLETETTPAGPPKGDIPF